LIKLKIKKKVSTKIVSNNLKKGLHSLENPMLRGSFSLVLTEKQMEFFDCIAKQAFIEIMNCQSFVVTSMSESLNTIHLSTDLSQIQNKRAGVFVIKQIENGMYIIGQTKDLKKRFNQYTSRETKKFFESNKIDRINKNFYNAVQQATA
jgi:hypothetical protein